MQGLSLHKPNHELNQTFLVFWPCITHLKHSSRPRKKPEMDSPANSQLLCISKSLSPKVSFVLYYKHFHGDYKPGRTPHPPPPPLPPSSFFSSFFPLLLLQLILLLLLLPGEQNHFLSQLSSRMQSTLPTNQLRLSPFLLVPCPRSSRPVTLVPGHNCTFSALYLCSHWALGMGV